MVNAEAPKEHQRRKQPGLNQLSERSKCDWVEYISHVIGYRRLVAVSKIIHIRRSLALANERMSRNCKSRLHPVVMWLKQITFLPILSQENQRRVDCKCSGLPTVQPQFHGIRPLAFYS